MKKINLQYRDCTIQLILVSLWSSEHRQRYMQTERAARTAVSEHWRRGQDRALTHYHNIYLVFCHFHVRKLIADWLKQQVPSCLFCLFFFKFPLWCYIHIHIYFFLYFLYAFDPIITVCMPDPSWSRERHSTTHET